MEKYDVVDAGRRAGGGEYPSQDGFGWTNGVALALSASVPTVSLHGGPTFADTRAAPGSQIVARAMVARP